ncbi:hypothetical protein H5410_035447, partial [Solanum commersonii]
GVWGGYNVRRHYHYLVEVERSFRDAISSTITSSRREEPCVKLSQVLSNYLSPILLRPTSTPPRTLYTQPLAPPHWGVNAPSFHMSKPSQSRFPQLVHHRGHSHLLPNNLVPNPIAPSVTTHPSQHPHLRDMHFLDMLSQITL